MDRSNPTPGDFDWLDDDDDDDDFSLLHLPLPSPAFFDRLDEDFSRLRLQSSSPALFGQLDDDFSRLRLRRLRLQAPSRAFSNPRLDDDGFSRLHLQAPSPAFRGQLDDDFLRLRLSASSTSPAVSRNRNFDFLPEHPFFPPSPSAPQPSAANADANPYRMFPPPSPSAPHPSAADADANPYFMFLPPYLSAPQPSAANADANPYPYRMFLPPSPPAPQPSAADADANPYRMFLPPSPSAPHPSAANADANPYRMFPPPSPPAPQPSAANADANPYCQQEFTPPYTAASGSAGPADSRLHHIPAEQIQFLNLSLLQRDQDEYVALFFPTVLHEVTNLILDRHDFRVLERFIDVCDERQRSLLLAAVAANPCMLLRICRDNNGSPILEKLIKYSRCREQISHILRALRPYILYLAKEKNGSHILKCCLSHPYFDRDKLQYALQPIVKNWAQLAVDRYGVSIVEEVVDLTTGNDASELLIKIVKGALELAQHPSGNYLIQHLLLKRIPTITFCILSKLRGHFADLAVQKYSSNVVEKCLKNTTRYECAMIILELLSSPNILAIFEHGYGNYVMQSALSVTTGDLHEKLLGVVKKNLPTLRQLGFYRKIIRKLEKNRNWNIDSIGN